MRKYFIPLLLPLAFGPGVVQAQGLPADTNGMACVYNSVLPTIVDKNWGTVQCDSNGRLIVTLPPSTTVLGKVAIDQTTPGTTNLVSAGLSQQVADTPTVQNAAYVSGNCIGGFRSVSVAVNNGQSGFVTNFRIDSVGGSTPTITVYLFDSNPSGSTCTDKSTFTLVAADVDKLIASPSAITLAAPTGTTITVASLDFLPPRPFISGGATNSGVKTLYYALVSGSTFTPASTTDIHTRTGVVLN